jgi:phthiodiolone/phenolphthiodiolone dimycocerosates ketoreductase
MFKVGLSEQPLYTRYSPTALVRASYLTAASSRVDSFRPPDHLSSLFPRSVMTSENVGRARLVPKIDAHYEPWTIFGYFAARKRLRERRFASGVTDASRRNPAITAQAAATLHLLTRGRAILGIGPGARTSNEPYGVDWSTPVARFEEAIATIRALWNSGGELVNRDSPFFRCAMPCSTYPLTAASGPTSGSPPVGRACCGLPAATPMAGIAAMTLRPKDYADSLETIRAAASDVTRCPSPPRAYFSS